MKLAFAKLSGAGNDFVLVTDRALRRARGTRAELARRLCDRRRGVGADGLLVVGKGRAPGAVALAYYNADGSAAFCGNGSRCAAWWAFDNGLARGRAFRLEAGAESLEAEVTGSGRVRISMPPVRGVRLGLRLPVAGETLTVHYLDTGVPHAVVFVKDAAKVDLERLGPLLRRHPEFGAAGANADFASEARGGALDVRTFERGVEGETLACGTGVAAVAAAASLLGLRRPPVRCRTRGGDVLTADFRLEDGQARGMRLEGPAEVTFEGTTDV